MQQLLPLVVPLIVLVFYAFWQSWISSNFDYQCANCGAIFTLQTWQAMIAPHAMWRKLVRCPTCGQMTWATLVRKGDGY
jgi:DNA-directed RNA polymerase subunit RPC12/RpoP